MSESALYWIGKLKSPLAILDLPLDFKRPLTISREAGVYSFSFPADKSQKIFSLVNSCETTLSNLFLTAYKITLARYSSLDDIIVGSSINGNVVALRTAINLTDSFVANLKNVSLTLSEAIIHSRVSFDSVLNQIDYGRDERRFPVFQTYFCLVDSIEDENNTLTTKSDLDFFVAADESNINICFTYRKDLFKEISIERFADCLFFLLDQMNESCNEELRFIPTVPVAHQELILSKWNNTWTSVDKTLPFHQLFEEQAKLTPGSIALENDHGTMTFSELDRASNRCANVLLEKGIGRNDLVGISLSRDFNLLVAILGVLKTGAGYIPLDPAFPQDRLDYMIVNARPKILLTEKKLETRFTHGEEKILISSIVNDNQFDYPRPEIEHQLSDTSYVIYTSGSTGNPKGVQLTHGSVTNFLLSMKQTIGFDKKDKILAVTTLSFDIAVLELFLPLISGGSIYLASAQEAMDGIALKNIIESKNISVMQATPTTWRLLLIAGWKGNQELKILCGGEAFPPDLAQSLIPICQEVWNMYGPTETTVWSLCKKLKSNDEFITIGKPIANTSVYILDDNYLMKPIGATGELFIGGHGLALGYFERADLTAERFIADPFIPGAKMYATGDLARFTYEGEVDCLGRNDGQVKVRGYRIELGEIEHALIRQDQISRAVVKIIDDEMGNFICAYFQGNAEPGNLREGLRQTLPEYMVPSYFIQLESIPMTLNGKIDYKNLPVPENLRPELSVEYVPAETASQQLIENCWKKHIRIQKIGIDDNFFDLGGTSLVAIKIMVDINQVSEKKLTVVDLFQYGTIRQIANFIDNEKDELDIFLQRQKNEENHSGDIAVISMTGKFPGAKNVDEFWENLIAVKNTIDIFKAHELNPAVPEELGRDGHYVFAEGSYPGQEYFDHKFFGMTPRESELVDPQQRKFLELSHEVLELAGYDPDTYSGSIGIFAGMGNSKYSRLVDQYPEKTKLFGDFNITLGLEKDYLATKVAFKLNLKGPALSIYTACSTSLVAIIEAVKNLRLKNCDMALAGGISISGAPNTGHLYLEGGIFSKNGECRAFDQHATGTVFTDGAGVVILKRLSDAERDGDNILAVIKGVGVNNDGANKISFTAPSVIGQAEAILRAQKDAGISADTLGFIEAHGTATPVGDPIEVEALTKAFSKSTDKKNFCYLSSVKSNIGHLTCAAGVASFIKAVKVVGTGIIPGTVHFTEANRLLEVDKTPFIITSETQAFPVGHELRRAGISSFGVGGTNAHVIIEEYKKSSDENSTDEASTEFSLFKLSAKSEIQLELMQTELLSFLQKTKTSEWRKIAYTLEVGRKEHKYRSFIVGSQHEDLSKITNSNSGKGKVTKQPSVYFMFPGQGSHYKQMGKGLYESSEIFRDIFDQCCELIGKHTDYKIKDIIFDESSNENLNNTFYSQPAIFIIEYSLAQTLKIMGIKPVASFGHSIGEFVAATINGVFTLEDGLRVISKRAEIMKELPTGMMLSVSMSEVQLSELIAHRELDIAAVNGSLSCVVAGKRSDVLAFKEELESRDIASIELKTSHAFHSRMMKPAVEIFLNFLKTLSISNPKEAMFSTVTTNLESDLFGTPEYWANHITNTVQFSRTVSKILKTSNILFLEVGTKNILSNLVKKEMQGLELANSSVVNLLGSKSEQENMSFHKALGDLWISGIKISDSGILFAAKDRRRVIAPVYVFEENKSWLEPKNKKVTHKNTFNTEDAMDSKLSNLQNKLIEIFETSSGIDVGTFDHDTTFLEMGMDSLFLSQLALAVKKEMKVNVTFRQLMEDFSSINLLSHYLLDKVELNAAKVSAPIIMHPPKKETPSVQVEPAVAAPVAVAQVQPQVQIQPIQTRTITPAVAPVMASGLESIINRQLELMSQQIMLLNGSQVTTTLSPVNNITASEIQIPAAMSAASQVNLPVKKGKVSVTNVKEAFGAQARITAEKSNQLNADQLKEIQKFIEKYNAKTKSSKKFTQDNRKNHSDPRAVTGFKPETKEVVYPIVVKKSYLQALWDLDDNQYIDMTCGFGSNFFGNGNETIKKHVINQIQEGIEIGPQHPLVADVSKMINEMTGSERVAFCSTGSESVLGAMRIARTVTGREKIIVFSGSYHGINDEVILRGSKSGSSYPAAPGINSEAVSNMIVLDYGTAESLQVIREMASEVAAVLIEPVQSRRCDFHPVEFLKEVRKITLESGTCLIFDEIITGFRIHPAGAQGYFGIKADLCTYGKVIGGGLPIGVIAGKAEYMDALDGGHWQYGDDSTPTVGVTYFAGTFCRHPLALASAKGALEVLKEIGAERLDQLNKRAQKFADDLNLFLLTEGAPIKMDNFGSLMKPKWTADIASGDLLFAILRYNGVHVYDGFPWFLNLAHTEKDLENVLDAFKNAVKSMQSLGLFPSKNQARELGVELDPNVFDQKGAPMLGAKLGRDEKGNPAWFMEDPENAGEYYLVKGH